MVVVIKWDIRQGETDGSTIGQIEAATQDEAWEKALDLHKPGWRDNPYYNDDGWDYIYVRLAKDYRDYDRLELHPFEKMLPDRWVKWIRNYKLRKNERDASNKIIFSLSATDFPPQGITVVFADDSKMILKCAFAAKEGNEIAIFTEHLGYFVYNAEDIIEVSPAVVSFEIMESKYKK